MAEPNWHKQVAIGTWILTGLTVILIVLAVLSFVHPPDPAHPMSLGFLSHSITVSPWLAMGLGLIVLWSILRAAARPNVRSTIASPAATVVNGTNVEVAKIQITLPRHGEILTDPNPLGPSSVSYLVRGKLKALPEGHQIWLLTADERFEQYWPQGFYPVQFNEHTGEWHGRVNGSGHSPLRIFAVVAPPTSQDFFRYFQKRGDETKKFIPLNRLPPECCNTASVQARLPGMEDYQIKSDGRGSFGVSALTERARTRAGPSGPTSNLTLWFRGGRADALQFVKVGEAEGFTFAGKDLLG
jgi:hypothetical protein